jgi:hypothetical protein
VNLRAELAEVDFGEITFAVPAQTFGITCAISTEQTLPVVTEVALRMIFVCDSLTPQALQEFFGFTEREVEQVINSLVDERLVRWEDDRLELTHYARGLFVNSPDSVPRLSRIKDWAGEVAFELVGFTPVNPTDGAKRARLMVEVPADDPEKESKTRLWAERSFQENFDRIYRGSRAEIYKISDVEASTRFLLAVPCTFSISLDGEFTVKRSLPEDFLSDRLELSRAITKLLAFPPNPDNRLLAEFGSLFGDTTLQPCFRSDGTFDLTAYLAKAVAADGAGSIVKPLVGSLHLGRNRKTLETWVGSLAAEPGEALTVHWIAPTVPFWARSKRMRPLVASLRKNIDVDTEFGSQAQAPQIEDRHQLRSVKILLQSVGDEDRQLEKTYGMTLPEVYGTSASALEGKLELVVVKGQLTCALYHFQLRHAVTIPIGFISTEERHVRVAEDLLKQLTDHPARLRTLTRGAPSAETSYRL